MGNSAAFSVSEFVDIIEGRGAFSMIAAIVARCSYLRSLTVFKFLDLYFSTVAAVPSGYFKTDILIDISISAPR